MSQITVKLSFLRQAPRKVRRVIDTIRGRSVDSAVSLLSVLPQQAARPVKKLLVSAVDAAKHRSLDPAKLHILAIRCDQGPALKRRRLNSRGRASLVKKYMSHITLTVSDIRTKELKNSRTHQGS